MRRADLPSRRPEHGLDTDSISAYVQALDNPELPAAPMKWTSRHSATITARISRDQILSVQISYHPGWQAAVNGRPCPVARDHLGQLVVEPACDGDCTVELRYDGGLEMRIARLISWTSFLGGFVWIATSRFRRANGRLT
jgi:uncharacterized membrane protein YfhO